tara:strand:- start:998 stop:2440 length:1443 start_codon:yes stop_codon:yes gene_type:complete
MGSLVYKKSLIFSYGYLAILALTQFLLVPQIIRVTSEQEYGVFVTFLTITTAFTNIVGWLGASSVRFLSNYFHQKQFKEFNRLYSLLRLSFLVYLLLIVPFLILLYKFYISSFLLIMNAPPVYLSLGMFILIASLILITVDSNVMNALTRADKLNKYRFLTSIVHLGLSIILLFIFNTSAVILLSLGISNFIIYFLIRRFYQNETLPISWNQFSGWQKSEIKTIFVDIGAKASLYSFLRLFILMDPVFLSFFLSGSQIANYSYFWLPANYIIIFLWKFSENIQPFFIKNFSLNKLKDNKTLYLNLFKTTLGLSIACASLYHVFLPLFLKIWVNYNITTHWFSYIFVFAIIFLVLYRLDLALLYSNVEYSKLIIISFIELVFKLVFILLFVKEFSFVSSVLGHCLVHLVIIQFLCRFYSFKLLSIQLVEYISYIKLELLTLLCLILFILFQLPNWIFIFIPLFYCIYFFKKKKLLLSFNFN